MQILFLLTLPPITFSICRWMLPPTVTAVKFDGDFLTPRFPSAVIA